MIHPGCADRLHMALEQREILELHETFFVSCNVKNKVTVVKRKHDYKDKKMTPPTPTTGSVCQRSNLLTERKRREKGGWQGRQMLKEGGRLSELLTGSRSADKVRAPLLSELHLFFIHALVCLSWSLILKFLVF